MFLIIVVEWQVPGVQVTDGAWAHPTDVRQQEHDDRMRPQARTLPHSRRHLQVGETYKRSNEMQDMLCFNFHIIVYAWSASWLTGQTWITVRCVLIGYVFDINSQSWMSPQRSDVHEGSGRADVGSAEQELELLRRVDP